MIRAVNVANTIIQRSLQDECYLNHMKLQKLIYILYKEYLKETNTSLFGENFQAWKTGCVLRSVYDLFKHYENNLLDECFPTYINGQKCYECLNLSKTNKSTRTLNIVFNYIWERYKTYTAIELAQFTIQPNTAWDKAIKSERYILLDEDIKSEPDFIKGKFE